MATAIPSTARAPTTSTPTTRHKTFKNISPHSIHPHPWTFARVLRVSRPSARARVSPQSNRAPDGAPRRRDVAMRRRDAMRCDSTRHATIRTWILVALKAATRETKEDARRADIFKEMRCANMTTATTTTRARSMRCDAMDGCDRSIDAIAIAMGSRTHTRSIDIDIDRSTVPIAIDARDDKIARRHATGR